MLIAKCLKDKLNLQSIDISLKYLMETENGRLKI